MRSLILSFSLLILCAPLFSQGDPDTATKTSTLDPEQAMSELEDARTKLDGVPKNAPAGSPDALLRQAWERRVELLGEAVDLLKRSEAQQRGDIEVGARRRSYEEKLAQLRSLASVEGVDSPTEVGFAELETRVAAQRERVTSLRDEEAERARYLDRIPALIAQARSRLQAALERGANLSRDGEAASDPVQKEILQIRAANAATDAEVARVEAGVLDKDRDLEKSLAPLRLNERELAERWLERSEKEYGLYRQALEEEIDREGLRREQELKRLESAVAAAQGPVDRFVAEKKLEIARFEKNEAEHGRFVLALRADLEEQQRRLTVEIDELKSLRAYLEKAGTGEQAGERLKHTMQRVKLRRQALTLTLRRDIGSELSSSRSRRYELEDMLFFLKETWDRHVESSAVELSEAAGNALRSAAQELVGPYRSSLIKEKDLLTVLIGVGQELQVALIERRGALDALESFIRSKVFWIRDAKPLGPALWPQVAKESRVVTAWAGNLASEGVTTRVSDRVTRPSILATLVFLLVGLPVGLFWVRQRLRRFVTRMNDRTVQQDARIIDRLLAVGVGILSVALLPIFLFVTGRWIHAAGLPETLAPVLASLLGHLAVFLFFWLLSRSFFAGRGTAQVQFGMDRDAAHNLHQSLGILLFGYLIFFTAFSILSRPPFLLESLPLEVLPRLAYTLFVSFATVAAILLLQPRSSFSRNWATALGDNFFGRRWPLLGGLLCFVGVGIVVLEIMGYRYGAGVLAENLALSLVALFAMVPLHRGAVAVFESFARARRARRLSLGAVGAEQPSAAGPAESKSPSGEEEPNSHFAMDGQELQIRRFLRVVFIIGGVVFIAGLWGIDSQAFNALDQLEVYDIRDSGENNEFVSYGDLLRLVFYGLGTFILLKYLPGLYEYGLFARLEIDSGLKYAILTMSRYGIFTLGVILMLSQIHLDLGRLGWLMAAMGVGLGFGLQEIVSNFVSGIILLIERPVRVGDVVTVGTTSGKVQRINIRATSVINFDRQEIIVPNRSLITKEVTNWTRGDTIIRLVVPIGVAYGSDVDQVTETLLQIARQQPEILTDPPPQAFFLEHGESSLDFSLRVFVPDPSAKMPLLHRLNRTINRSLTDQGIEIPFPQRDLHIRSSAVPWPARDAAEATAK